MNLLAKLTWGLGLMAALTATSWAGRAPARPATNAPAARPEATPARPETTTVVIPRSVFQIPKTPAEGRDPFFPESTRLFAAPGEVVRTNAPAGPVELRLRGLALGNKALATLSTVGPAPRTVELAAGEEKEIVLPAGRVRVRCLEIKTDSVIVEVGGTRRELHLRPGF